MKSLLLTFAVGLALTGPLTAALFSYQIDGIITNAPNVPNIIPGGPQWSFDTIPAPFTGSFVADAHHAGPISNLSLEIGGVDVVAAHPDVLLNLFDPSTNRLFWAGRSAVIEVEGVPIDPSFISLGYTTFGSPPAVPFDRIVAVQNTDASNIPPADPVWLRTINFEGSFDVKKGVAVPEAGTTVVSATIGFSMLFLISGLRGRKARRR